MDINKVIKIGGPLIILGVVLSETVAHILAAYIIKELHERGRL